MDKTETKTVVVEREIPHPPEKLWRALTQPHLLQEWLMKNDFKPEVGHRFQLKKEAGGYDIVIDCKVLSVEPHKRLSYEWDYIVGDPAYDTRSVVTFTLTPKGSGTHLRVEQSGFRPNQRQAFGGARQAWAEFFEGLEKLLSGLD
jgi:uncharacterized protein YndB with AHSA1/START domain